MARARIIKPSFFSNDTLSGLNPLARILFAGLWTIADREGRLEGRPKRIKASILPYDDCNIEELLIELHNFGFIEIYKSDNCVYIQVINFKKHQRPHAKESPSVIPAPTKVVASNNLGSGEQSPFCSLTLNPLPLTLNLSPSETEPKNVRPEIIAQADLGNTRADHKPNPEEARRTPEEPRPPKSEPCADIGAMMQFDTFWDLCPSKIKRSECRDEFFQHIKNGVPAEKIIDGIRRYRAYIDAGLENPRYVKGSLKWLQERHWTNPYITEKKDEQPKRIRGLVV